MPSPIDVYGAIANHVASNVGDISGGVWVCEEPETKELNYVVVDDRGFKTQFSMESVYTSDGTLSLHVFAANALTARTIGKAIKDLFGPYDSERLITTDGTFQFVYVTESGFQLAIEPDPDREGARIFRYTIDYNVGIQGSYQT